MFLQGSEEKAIIQKFHRGRIIKTHSYSLTCYKLAVEAWKCWMDTWSLVIWAMKNYKSAYSVQ